MAKASNKLVLNKTDLTVMNRVKNLANMILNFLPPDHPEHKNAKMAYDGLESLIDAGPEFDLMPKDPTKEPTNGQTENKQQQTVVAK